MVSVIIPTYNRENTIERAIESVLNQTYNDIEVLVIDDCSIDNTEKIVKKIKDNRLKYIKLNKNSGACFARNEGIRLAKGEYIAFQDSDDYWYDYKLEKQIKNMEKYNSEIDFCRINVIGEFDGSKVIKPKSSYVRKIKKGSNITKLLCKDSFISTQSIIGKSYVFKNNFFDIILPRLQDYDICLRLSKQYKISLSENVLVDVYVQGDSISKNNKKLLAACNIILNKDYHFNEIETKLIKSNLYKVLGDTFLNNDIPKSLQYYKLSIKNKFTVKVFLKYIIYKCKKYYKMS